MDLDGKKLLILGGGILQKEIVLEAKKLGLYAVVTDWNPVEKSPAKQLADEYLKISTADTESLAGFIKENNVSGVITGFSDVLLHHYVDLCERVKLPYYANKVQLKYLHNKKRFKNLCRKFGIKTPKEYSINFEDICFPELEFPVVVKPVDGEGGKGLTICKNIKELNKTCKRALSFSRSNQLISEQYLQGDEITVFYLFNNRQVILTAVADRLVQNVYKSLPPLPIGYLFPSKYTENYIHSVHQKVTQMFNSLDIKYGFAYIQAIVHNGEIYFLEAGFRLTPVMDFKLSEKVVGINPLRSLIEFAVTGKMGLNVSNEITANWSKYGCNVTILCSPGTIKKVEGIENISEIPQVIDVIQSYREGDTIKEEWVGTLLQIFLRILFTAEDETELREVSGLINDIIDKRVKVISENGENILLKTKVNFL